MKLPPAPRQQARRRITRVLYPGWPCPQAGSHRCPARNPVSGGVPKDPHAGRGACWVSRLHAEAPTGTMLARKVG